MSRPWLDVMPRLELRPGVPVVDGEGETRVVLATGHEVDGGHEACALWDGATLQEVFIPTAELRVDLEDPIGLSYAIRELVSTASARSISPADVLPSQAEANEILLGWLADETTDEHRETLAGALARVLR